MTRPADTPSPTDARHMGLLDALQNLEKGYSRSFAVQFLKDDVWAAIEALERLVADLETNSERGAPDYAHEALTTVIAS